MTFVFDQVGTVCTPILGFDVAALGAMVPVAETGESLTVTATVDAAITKRPTKALRNLLNMCFSRLFDLGSLRCEPTV
jgi:hypothetical protein